MGDTLERLKARKLAASEQARQKVERERQLDARIKKQEKAIADAKAFAIGRAVMAKMEHDTVLRKTIGDLLADVLKTPKERMLFDLKPVASLVQPSEGEPVDDKQPASA